jgi:hypothetical protein
MDIFLLISVVDPHCLNANPDPGSQINADPNTDPIFVIKEDSI